MLQSRIAIKINDKAFVKDPLSSDLGGNILRKGVELIEELGFEKFTFKKLAIAINSTEASIYRYFTNKHNLLAYLTMWYWSWSEYKIMMSTLNIQDPEVKLRNAIGVLTEEIEEDLDIHQIDEVKLHQIVIMESSKVYFCKTVDEDNKQGFFKAYKDLVQSVATIVNELNPNYKYPHMLVSSIIEGAHHQRYFADHLPRLTDNIKNEDSVSKFYTELAIKAIINE